MAVYLRMEPQMHGKEKHTAESEQCSVRDPRIGSGHRKSVCGLAKQNVFEGLGESMTEQCLRQPSVSYQFCVLWLLRAVQGKRQRQEPMPRSARRQS